MNVDSVVRRDEAALEGKVKKLVGSEIDFLLLVLAVNDCGVTVMSCEQEVAIIDPVKMNIASICQFVC